MAKATTSMDYAEHEKTFGLFMTMLKFSITAIVLGVVALYFFAIVGNFWAGLLFIVIAVPAGLFAAGLVGKKR